MSQSLSHNYIHLIFSTKERRPLLQAEVSSHLHAYMAKVLQNQQSPALEVNSVEDHVHILFNLHRTRCLSRVVEQVKSSSSKWLKTQSLTLSKFAWQAGYGAFSVSESNIPAVVRYIQQQQEHHREKTFQEEFKEFLVKHRVKFDERYLWG